MRSRQNLMTANFRARAFLLIAVALTAFAAAGCASTGEGTVTEKPPEQGEELTAGQEFLNVVAFPFRMIGYGLYYSCKFLFWDLWAGLLGLLFPGPAEGSEERLVADLSSREPGRRAAAAIALGMLGSVRAALKLVAMLDDESDQAKSAAALALTRIRDASTIEPLCEIALSKREERARAAAVRILGFQGDQAAAFTLSKAMGDDSWLVRAEAAVASGKLKLPAAIPGIVSALKDPDPRVRGAAAIGLSHTGDRRALPPLREAFSRLEKEGTFVRAAVITALAELGDRSMVRRFMQVARGESRLLDPHSMAAAAWGLGRLKAVEAAPLLNTLLLGEDRELAVADSAAQALAMLGRASTLTKAAYSEDVVARLAAVRGLLGIGSDEAVATLAVLSADPYSDVRQRSIVALLHLGRREAVPMMIAELESPDVEIRSWAFLELKRISHRDLGLDTREWRKWWEERGGSWDPAKFYPRAEPSAGK